MTKYTPTTPVSRSALIRRINRTLEADPDLAHRAERLVQERAQAKNSPKGYHVLDEGRTIFIDPQIDLEEYGRELGVLKDWERLVKDEDK